ncbi:glycoside hydrolase family 3 domain protein [Beutenbergia cavernae DSM 12333]|uniref:Glycoside hydrolase family 3 domain protein n=1 Tax=Beutenbergia cavernae (strain ATCC BAA-8 / DSM 12333 / CCUG 43141 / JCM 11478 / NBRC 16432 / NCIMB 13614 / HKI 0122) TaxID=471853 RepID=C5C2H5_BEUC1|nr:glycoside hydrolase family 3 N-terminal domain-containing protein [Beutenbergia cavernae]ACQ79661.1 glycoside hydrolase family 3 domain protein [Beutenbergia cavernae DSM 12333]
MTDTTLERLARSVIWPGFAGTVAPDWLQEGLEGGLAGAVLFGHNLAANDPGPDDDARAVADAAQLSALCGQIHDARDGTLIGIDEEGGLVTRLHSRRGSFAPGHGALGRYDVESATRRVARQIAGELREAGVDVDLAPVADVNVDPRNPVIGTRSFGADPALVARHTAAYVAGLQSGGVAACAKHFPGHGDTHLDSHHDSPRVDLTMDELERWHLPPFAAAIEAGVRAVLTAHITVTALGEEPATVNPAAIALLRDMGFDGVVVTDAIDMAAIRAVYGRGPGAVRALAAGVDLLCLGNGGAHATLPGAAGYDELEYREVLAAIVGAVENGDLAASRLEEAARRVATLSDWVATAPVASSAGLDAAGAVEIAATACAVTGDVRVTASPTLTVLDARSAVNVAAGRGADLVSTALRERTPIHRIELRTQVDHGRSVADGARAAVERAEGEVVVVVDAPHRIADEAAALAATLEKRADAVVVVLGWPDDPRLGEGGVLSGTDGTPVAPTRVLHTYGSSAVSARAAAELLLGPA